MPNSEASGKEPRTGPTKKPYVAPCYECSQMFETLALACGKLSQTQHQCHFNPKVS